MKNNLKLPELMELDKNGMSIRHLPSAIILTNRLIPILSKQTIVASFLVAIPLMITVIAKFFDRVPNGFDFEPRKISFVVSDHCNIQFPRVFYFH